MSKAAKHEALKWISARHLQHFVAQAEVVGADVAGILDDAGLVAARLADPEYLVPVSAVELMLSTVTRDHDQPLLGLRLARKIQPATFGPIGYMAQACTTFADVLDVITRYSGLLSNIGKTSVERRPDAVEIRWECTAGGRIFRRQATEYVLGSLVVISRLLMPNRKDWPTSITFAHAKLDSQKHSREYISFFQCPVYFEREHSSIVLPVRVLKAKLRHGDALVKDLLERHAANVLKQRTHVSSLSDEVGHLIESMIVDGAPSKDTVAAQLGMSGRSLHRKLLDIGTSYRELLDQVRLDVANERLKDARDTTVEISEGLGFSTRQAFLRWYKQQTGRTPGEYRNTINPRNKS